MPLAVNPLTPCMTDFLVRFADATPDESVALTALLAQRAVDKPAKLARLTLKDLGFGPDVPPGYIATMAEALEQARRIRSAQEADGLFPQPSAPRVKEDNLIRVMQRIDWEPSLLARCCRMFSPFAYPCVFRQMNELRRKRPLSPVTAPQLTPFSDPDLLLNRNGASGHAKPSKRIRRMEAQALGTCYRSVSPVLLARLRDAPLVSEGVEAPIINHEIAH